MYRASLIEPGVKYFLNETLKNVHSNKTKYQHLYLNTILFILFVLFISGILYYKYINKPDENEREKNKIFKEKYLLNTIKSINDQKKQERDEMITGLPKFENDFVKLHKNFYNI